MSLNQSREDNLKEASKSFKNESGGGVMRSMKSDDTTEELMEWFRTYYNFIRPHQSLEGKTPAEVSGLYPDLGENKWLSLIKRASAN